MEIGPGEKGSIELPLGEKTALKHNRPVTYQVETVGGSLIEVEVPGGVEFNITSAGDIKAVNVNIYDAQRGPSEVV